MVIKYMYVDAHVFVTMNLCVWLRNGRSWSSGLTKSKKEKDKGGVEEAESQFWF